MRNNIPSDPNPFITAWLVGPESEVLMRRVGQWVALLYQALEVKRTGAMAGSATVNVHIGGPKGDRNVADVIVTDPAAASHIFGAGFHPRSTGRHHNRAAQTLETVLRLTSGGRG